jgi:hypothetical protein
MVVPVSHIAIRFIRGEGLIPRGLPRL